MTAEPLCTTSNTNDSCNWQRDKDATWRGLATTKVMRIADCRLGLPGLGQTMTVPESKATSPTPWLNWVRGKDGTQDTARQAQSRRWQAHYRDQGLDSIDNQEHAPLTTRQVKCRMKDSAEVWMRTRMAKHDDGVAIDWSSDKGNKMSKWH
jgi:hypothetical protein